MFLPGIIAALIIDLLTSHRKRSPFHFILHSYLLGVISYGLLMLIVFISNKIVLMRDGKPTWEVTFLKSLLNNKEDIVVNEVFYASFIGIAFALLIAVSVNKMVLYGIANKLGISHKHGENDVWDYMFNSDTINWINIRDNNLIYQGKIVSYSEKEGIRELFLKEVKVFSADDSSTELYEMPFIYFNFDVGSNIIIEVMF